MDAQYLGLMQQIPPATYQQYNLYNATFSPSTVHCRNTALTQFFASYLMEDVYSVFKFTLPDTIDKSYFLPVLFFYGYISVFRTDMFGIIAQGCGLYGYNVYYRPTHAIVTNPLLKQQTAYLEIGKMCALIRLKYDYTGLWDIVSYYADILSLAAESMGINIINTRLAYVFPTENKAKGETFKEMYDRIAEGNPTVVIDKAVTNDTSWEPVFNNISSNYISGDLLELMRGVKAEFLTRIGIPNANTGKKERLIKAEVERNNVETASLPELWLEMLKEGMDTANRLFGGGFGVERRFNENGSSAIDSGNVQLEE